MIIFHLCKLEFLIYARYPNFAAIFLSSRYFLYITFLIGEGGGGYILFTFIKWLCLKKRPFKSQIFLHRPLLADDKNICKQEITTYASLFATEAMVVLACQLLALPKCFCRLPKDFLSELGSNYTSILHPGLEHLYVLKFYFKNFLWERLKVSKDLWPVYIIFEESPLLNYIAYKYILQAHHIR